MANEFCRDHTQGRKPRQQSVRPHKDTGDLALGVSNEQTYVKGILKIQWIGTCEWFGCLKEEDESVRAVGNLYGFIYSEGYHWRGTTWVMTTMTIQFQGC